MGQMQDKYGSPSMEDLTVFSRNFNNRLEGAELTQYALCVFSMIIMQC